MAAKKEHYLIEVGVVGSKDLKAVVEVLGCLDAVEGVVGYMVTRVYQHTHTPVPVAAEA